MAPSQPLGTVTPMMAQYLTIKADYKDVLLFYRMGDFYELFFDDALKASKALDIALTKRGKHAGQDIAMCGVPAHSAESYLLSLIKKGFRVAVCEQLEDPVQTKKRGAKAVVKRDVVRLITPGTLTEDALLDPRQNNFLAALANIRDHYAFAWIDISTGSLNVMQLAKQELSAELTRLAPREVLIAIESPSEIFSLIENIGAAVTPVASSTFDSQGGEKLLKEIYNIHALDSFGSFERTEISALGALMDYLKLTQKGQLPRIKPPQKETTRRHMQIDAQTRKNLELTRKLSGQKEGSLLHAIDRTLSASGARLLFYRLSTPSLDINEIKQRQDSVKWIFDNINLASAFATSLRQVPDIDRALSRIALKRGNPRDLGALRNGLSQANNLASLIDSTAPQKLQSAGQNMKGQDNLIALLQKALASELPHNLSDGNFIASGYDNRLDKARALRDEGRRFIARLQSDYVTQTGISSLKIKHNNVLGYFIETTANHAEKMLSTPLSEHFIHRQTTANSVRFTTVELSDLATKILNAGEQALELEKTIFAYLSEQILREDHNISKVSTALAELDIAHAFADLAHDFNWCCPHVTNDRTLNIQGGRHPVVEQALRKDGAQHFVANACLLSAANENACLTLLTGPNMAGKSTYLRQCALIILLAQIGSYVPAHKADIGIVSQLFSRVGASDDLAGGRSTFMVEMIETATILNQADKNAFVILDEIGRGTATYDGLSIAWATLEYLHDINRCRGIFATHYHEMTALSERLKGVSNATMSVREHKNDVIFLYEVHQGVANRSYGVQVARLAGLPPSVIARARNVLEMLEKNEAMRTKKTLIDDLPLFSEISKTHISQPLAHGDNDPIRQYIETLSPDKMRPLDAIATIYELKELLKKV